MLDLNARISLSHAYRAIGTAKYIHVYKNTLELISDMILGRWDYNWIMLKPRNTHRFLVPFFTEIQVVSVDDKENVVYNEQVMGVPEGIEASEFF